MIPAPDFTEDMFGVQCPHDAGASTQTGTTVAVQPHGGGLEAAGCLATCQGRRVAVEGDNKFKKMTPRCDQWEGALQHQETRRPMRIEP